MNQTNEPENCKVCKVFYASPQFDSMCSKCYKDQNSNLTTQNQTHNEVESFQLSSMLPQQIEQKKSELSQNKVEQKIDTVTATQIEKVDEVKPKEAPKDKCYKCDRKTGFRGIVCKCTFNFCMKCRLPEEHDCDFDHGKFEKERLKAKLVRVVGDKF